MNIIVTRSCSNNCPYCFEAKERQHTGPDALEVGNARKLAAWSARAGVESLGFLGGEPFLHPDFREIVDAFVDSCPEVPRTIFTGGLVDQSAFAQFSPIDASLLFNINERRDYRSDRECDQVLDLVDRAIRTGFDVFLGFNVWRTNFDPSFMPHLARDLGRQGFRWTVANPMLGAKPKTVFPSQFEELSDRCVEMLRIAAGFGLSCTLDCHLPLCFFNDEQLAWIARYQPQTSAHLGTCDPPIDITPEMEAIRCFATSQVLRARVLDFGTVAELQNYMRKEVDQKLLTNSMIFEECTTCEFFRAGRCQGGCFGWSQGSAEGDSSTLAETVYERLHAGDAAEALQFVETASHWFHTPLSLYLAAVAAQSLGKHATAYRYAARSLSQATDGDLKKKLLAFFETLPPNLPGDRKQGISEGK